MFAKLKQRWQDTRTIMKLSLDAEQRALREGQQHPGAEHYTLAALDLADGSARRVFARIGADPEAYRAALANRHAAALSAIGIDAAVLGGAPAAASPGATAPRADGAGAAEGLPPPAEPTLLFDAQPSGQTLMQSLPELQRRLPAPLCGAHVLLAAPSRPAASICKPWAAPPKPNCGRPCRPDCLATRYPGCRNPLPRIPALPVSCLPRKVEFLTGREYTPCATY